MIIFDYDGTLYDTQELVMRSYELVGVHRDYVKVNWGKSWQEWLPEVMERKGGTRSQAGAVHDAKNELYRTLVRVTPPQELPALKMLRAVVKEGLHVGILTGASFIAQTPAGVNSVWIGKSQAEKVEVLRNGRPSLYVADGEAEVARRAGVDYMEVGAAAAVRRAAAW